MNKFIKFSLVAIFAIFVAACSARREPIETPTGIVPESFTLAEVKKGINIALAERGWIVTYSNDQLIKARLSVRTHVAEIEIPYSEKSYEIKYVSSQNLKDEADGSIHGRYNSWVGKLKLEINKSLSNLYVQKNN